MSTAGLDRLREVIAEMGSVVVTFSGGVDSAIVSKMAHDILGAKALSITARSDTLPDDEVMDVEKFVAKWKVGHRFVASDELSNEAYQANTGDRCYHCKSELFSIAERVRAELGFSWVVDGTIVDDLGDHRPGLVAASESAYVIHWSRRDSLKRWCVIPPSLWVWLFGTNHHLRAWEVGFLLEHA